MILIWTVGLWWVYIIVMWLKKRRDVLKKKSRPLYYLAYLFAFVGVVLDVAYNLTYGSVIFLDPPRELSFTSRLKRYRRGPVNWRWNLATWFCERLLNPYDKGHC